MHSNGELGLLNEIVRGRLTRRRLLGRAGAVGAGAPALASLLALSPRGVVAHQGSGGCTGEVTWALESSPQNIIPFGALSLAQWQGKEFMYDSLLEFDRDLIPQPALAESWETPDELTYFFKLRQGVTFHNGAPMTAGDVKYSLEQAKTPPPPGGPVPFLANIASVEATDDATVTITMSKVDPTLIGVFAWGGYTPIVPEGIYEQINVLSEGVGTGPFRLVEYVQDDRIVYECNPDYWKAGVPCVARITLKVLTDEQARVAALRSGEIDGGTFSPDVVQTLEGDDELTVLTGLTSSPRVIHFNTVNDVPWRDARVRQAINKVVDRQEIIDKVYGGEADLTGPIPPGYGDWPLTQDEYAAYYANDVEQAKALMAEAGLADGFSVTLQAISAPRDYTQIAEIIQEQLKAININVSVEPLEIGGFAANIGSGEFEWASTARGMRGDPSGYVIDFRSGTGLHVAWFGEGWKNEELDGLYDEALATVDQAARQEMYKRIQQIVAEEVPNLYTVQPRKFQVVRNRLSGMYVAFVNTNEGLRVACVTEE